MDSTLLRRWRRTLAMLLHFAAVWAIAVTVIRRLAVLRGQSVARSLAAQTLLLLKVRVRIRGSLPRVSPVLLVANHVSWLDVYVLNCLLTARFIAKREVRAWPFVGATAASFGTLFIRRGCPRDAHRVKEQVAAALRRGERVVVFPEGTTTDGSSLARFYPALFQAAIDAGAWVQPVAIRYRDAAHRPTTAAAFVDDMDFLTSLGKVAAEPSLHAELVFGPQWTAYGRGRRDLALESQRWIACELDIPADGGPARRSRRRFARAA